MSVRRHGRAGRAGRAGPCGRLVAVGVAGLLALGLAAGCSRTAFVASDGSAGTPKGNQPASPTAQAATPTANPTGAPGSSRPGRAAQAGQPLPDVRLTWVTGGSGAVELRSLSGTPAHPAATPTVLNVWASWCPPCRYEAPHFQTLHAEAGNRVRVVGIDYADSAGPARATARSLGLAYSQIADTESQLKVPFGLVGVPATVFVSPTGKVVHISHVPYRTESQLFGDVERYLGVRP